MTIGRDNRARSAAHSSDPRSADWGERWMADANVMTCGLVWGDTGAHRCHLTAGHDGDHRCGCDAIHHEWTDEDEDAATTDRHRAETKDGL